MARRHRTQWMDWSHPWAASTCMHPMVHKWQTTDFDVPLYTVYIYIYNIRFLMMLYKLVYFMYICFPVCNQQVDTLIQMLTESICIIVLPCIWRDYHTRVHYLWVAGWRSAWIHALWGVMSNWMNEWRHSPDEQLIIIKYLVAYSNQSWVLLINVFPE